MKITLVDVLLYGPTFKGVGPEVRVVQHGRTWRAQFNGLNRLQRQQLIDATPDSLRIYGDTVDLNEPDVGNAVELLLRTYGRLTGDRPIYRFRWSGRMVCVEDRTQTVVLDSAGDHRLANGTHVEGWLQRLKSSELCQVEQGQRRSGVIVGLTEPTTSSSERIQLFRTLLGMYMPPDARKK